MNFYPEGYTVEVTVNFTDLNGSPVTPTGMTAALYDGEEVLIQDFGSLVIAPGSTSRVVVIGSAFNNLSGSEPRELRVLKAVLTTAFGNITHTLAYAIEDEQTVQIMTNSFMTPFQAEIIAADHVNLNGWDAADSTRRRAALVEAYRRIIAIPMRYNLRNELGQEIPNEERFISRDAWTEMTAEAFRELPSRLQRALKMAQLLEANELLAGDSVTRKHRAGVISETIGESSITLRGGRVDYGLSAQALSALAGYIWFNNKIARSS